MALCRPWHGARCCRHFRCVFFLRGAWAPSSLADAGCRFRCARRRAVFFWRRSRGRASFKNADFGPKRRVLLTGAAEQLGRPVRCAGAAACTHIARTAVESPIIKNNNQIQTRIKSTRLTQVPRQTSYGLPEPTTFIIFGEIFCDKYIS